MILKVDDIKLYHAHLYYDSSTLDEAHKLRTQAGDLFGLGLGTMHEKLVGPHPRWSCQLTVGKEQFAEVIPWLALNRGNIDVFVHPDTGNDYADHTNHVIWLGRQFPLQTHIFKRNENRR